MITTLIILAMSIAIVVLITRLNTMRGVARAYNSEAETYFDRYETTLAKYRLEKLITANLTKAEMAKVKKRISKKKDDGIKVN